MRKSESLYRRESADNRLSLHQDHLRHMIYIASLPTPSDLTTPLYFTDSELDLLDGSNLAGAVVDRRNEWQKESKAIQQVLRKEGLTWYVQFLSSF